MRYFVAGLTMLLAVSSWAADTGYNESVAAISYNPSRLGAYNHLKIVSTATVSGIDATNAEVNILTQGTVNVVNSNYTGTESHQITTVLPMPDVASCASYSSLCNRNNNDATTYLKINGNGAVIAGNPSSSPYTGNLPAISSNTGWPSSGQGTTLNLKGGTIGFSKADVFIRTIGQQITNLNLDASGANGQLRMGSGNAVTPTIKVAGTGATFKLGRTNITGNNNCNNGFTWKQRNDDQGRKAKILACQRY